MNREPQVNGEVDMNRGIDYIKSTIDQMVQKELELGKEIVQLELELKEKNTKYDEYRQISSSLSEVLKNLCKQ